MRVLLISHAYPPDPEVGSLRGAKVAAALAAAGHDVQVVTNRLAGETQAIRAGGRGVTVHAGRSIPHPRRAYLRAKHWFGRDGGGGAAAARRGGAAGPRGAGGRRVAQ